MRTRDEFIDYAIDVCTNKCVNFMSLYKIAGSIWMKSTDRRIKTSNNGYFLATKRSKGELLVK